MLRQNNTIYKMLISEEPFHSLGISNLVTESDGEASVVKLASNLNASISWCVESSEAVGVSAVSTCRLAAIKVAKATGHGECVRWNKRNIG